MAKQWHFGAKQTLSARSTVLAVLPLGLLSQPSKESETETQFIALMGTLRYFSQPVEGFAREPRLGIFAAINSAILGDHHLSHCDKHGVSLLGCSDSGTEQRVAGVGCCRLMNSTCSVPWYDPAWPMPIAGWTAATSAVVPNSDRCKAVYSE